MASIDPDRVFTLDVGDRPTLAFLASDLSEARELAHTGWLRADLQTVRSAGAPLWNGHAALNVRMATPDESEVYRDGWDASNTGIADDKPYIYLVNID